MLSKKFKRASWLSHSLLLIAIPGIGNIPISDTSGKECIQDKDTTIVQLQAADSLQAYAAVPKMYLNKSANKFVTDF